MSDNDLTRGTALDEIERLRADLAHAQRCLDSYADENQRLFDRAEKAEAQRDMYRVSAQDWIKEAGLAEAALPTAEQIEEIKQLVERLADAAGSSTYAPEDVFRADLHAALDALRNQP